MFEYGQCGWKDRHGKRCTGRAVAIRDLGPTYGTLRLQYVCEIHANKGDETHNPYARRSEDP